MRLQNRSLLAVSLAVLFGIGATQPAAAQQVPGEGEYVGVARFLSGAQYFDKTGVPLPEFRAKKTDKTLQLKDLPAQEENRQVLPTSEEHARKLALEHNATYGTASETVEQQQNDDITPEECRSNPDKSSRPEGWIKNHFSYCQLGLLSFDQFRRVGPILFPVGGFSARITNMGYTYNGLRDMDWGIRVDQIDSWGLSNIGILRVEADCAADPAGSCRTANNGVSKLVPDWENNELGQIFYHSPADPSDPANGEQRATGTFQIEYEFRTRFTQDRDGPETSVRFDSAWYLPNKQGSIFNRVDPYLTFSTSDDEVKQSAFHIKDAQEHPGDTYPKVAGKKIPGASAKEPLHRLYHDAERRRQNREDFAVPVCKQQWPGYEELGQQCDEYPHASTYEGAARHLYEPVPYGQFSVRPINGYDNENSGRRLGTWYGNDRILDGDAFFIRIVS